MDWITKITAYATMAQAFSGMIALGIATAAVVVPWHQQRRREQSLERDNSLKRRCLATAIRFDLGKVAMSLGLIKITATGQSFLPEAVLSGSAVQGILSSKVELPPTLLQTADQVYLLGDPAGPILLRLLAVLEPDPK